MDNTKITQQQSDLIAISRLVMIVGLTYLHLFSLPGSNSYPRYGMSDYTFLISDAINALAHNLFMAAVPMLSIISGYLFFSKKIVSYSQVIKNKFFSLALPSWIWCSIWLLFAYCLFLIGHQRGLFESLNYNFNDFSLITLLNGVFGITEEQFAFQFWFIRDLILTIILFPVIQYGIKLLGIGFIFVLFAIWFLGIEIPVFFSLNVFLFFSVGSYLSLSKKLSLENLNIKSNFFVILLGMFFLVLLFLRSCTSIIFLEDDFLYGLARHDFFLKLLRVFGVLFFIQVFWYVVENYKKTTNFLSKYSGYSFFIFALHYPIIELVKAIVGKIPGQASHLGTFLAWLIIPVITISICTIVIRLTYKLFPNIFSVLNGSRALIK